MHNYFKDLTLQILPYRSYLTDLTLVIQSINWLFSETTDIFLNDSFKIWPSIQSIMDRVQRVADPFLTWMWRFHQSLSAATKSIRRWFCSRCPREWPCSETYVDCEGFLSKTTGFSSYVQFTDAGRRAAGHSAARVLESSNGNTRSFAGQGLR